MKSYIGAIRCVYDDGKIFTIKDKHQIHYFFLSKSLQKKFNAYLNEGVMVNVKVLDTEKIVDDINCLVVHSFDKIYKNVGSSEIVYYDTKEIKEGVVKLLNKDNYRLFIDLEFTMPEFDYHHNKENPFIAEICEYGLYIEDAEGNMIDSSFGYVRPNNLEYVNSRTCEFIGVNQETLLNAPRYSKFYDTLNDYLTIYQPVIYIWGKNDYLMIQRSYELNNVKPLTERKNFINLMQIMKTYYNRRDDIGLYKAYELLGVKPFMEIQDHNSLHDAFATLEIFHLFIDELTK